MLSATFLIEVSWCLVFASVRIRPQNPGLGGGPTSLFILAFSVPKPCSDFL